MEQVEMPTGGDPTGIPATSAVKNKDILIEYDHGFSYISLVNILWQLAHDEIRSITIIKRGGINR
ncbi:MAG: hypothetical protein EHM49_02990 [Deltaproteobacteria bacterium]|nr:MAG: hypothetical protein EHM49_02990 [Deltaproteobacteria bacterium]